MSDSETTMKPSSPRVGQRSYLFWAIILVILAAAVFYNNRMQGPPPPSAVEWVSGLETAKTRAAESNRLLLIDFFAEWCGPCRMLDHYVFPRKDVAEALGEWIAVKVDVDKESAIASKYEVRAMPTLVVLSPQGEELTRFTGYMDGGEFINWVKSVEKTWVDKKPAGEPGAARQG